MAHMTKKRLAILGGVVALGLAGPAVAYAADSPSPAPSSSAGTTADPGGHHRPGRGEHGPDQGAFAKALAKELGIDEQKVTDALAKVREQLKPRNGDGRPPRDGRNPDQDRQAMLTERLAQAVKDGKLTQAEADAVAKAASAGLLMPGGAEHR